MSIMLTNIIDDSNGIWLTDIVWHRQEMTLIDCGCSYWHCLAQARDDIDWLWLFLLMLSWLTVISRCDSKGAALWVIAWCASVWVITLCLMWVITLGHTLWSLTLRHTVITHTEAHQAITHSAAPLESHRDITVSQLSINKNSHSQSMSSLACVKQCQSVKYHYCHQLYLLTLLTSVNTNYYLV
jgi:hypothetical protein